MCIASATMRTHKFLPDFFFIHTFSPRRSMMFVLHSLWQYTFSTQNVSVKNIHNAKCSLIIHEMKFSAPCSCLVIARAITEREKVTPRHRERDRVKWMSSKTSNMLLIRNFKAMAMANRVCFGSDYVVRWHRVLGFRLRFLKHFQRQRVISGGGWN